VREPAYESDRTSIVYETVRR